MTPYIATVFLCLSILLQGCASTPPGTPLYGTDKTSDIAKPKGSNVDYSKSLILGPGNAWVGRLTYTCNQDIPYMWDFLQAEMTRLGWTYLSGTRSGISVMIFKRPGRVATVQLKDRFISGTIVICDMSPESSGETFGSGEPLTLPSTDPMPPQPPSNTEYGAFTP
jgi:hypothetical protein